MALERGWLVISDDIYETITYLTANCPISRCDAEQTVP
jgi:hypothetical protein